MAKHSVIPKGAAVALDRHPAYEKGREAFRRGFSTSENPHDFFGPEDEYLAHYAWTIGWQAERSAQR